MKCKNKGCPQREGYFCMREDCPEKTRLKVSGKPICSLDCEQLEEENKKLREALELIKISMELSEEPFYKGMKILTDALNTKN